MRRVIQIIEKRDTCVGASWTVNGNLTTYKEVWVNNLEMVI